MSSTQRRWLVAVAVLLVGVGLVVFVRKGTTKGSELPVYTTGAERMLSGEEIYRPSDEKPFTYPPFFAVPFLPLVGVPAEPPRPAWFFVAWYLANVGALAWIVAIVRRRLVGPAPGERAPPEAWFWILTGLLAVRHVTAVFENQSHDLLVFLLVALGADAYCGRREARAGIWIGVAAACKATPLLFGWPWVLQRRVLAVGCLAVAFVVATLLPDLLFPRLDGRLWAVAWYETFLRGVAPGATAASGAWDAHSFLNQGLSGTLHRLLTPLGEGVGGPFALDVTLLDAGRGGRTAVTALASLAVLGLIGMVAWPSRSVGLTDGALSRRRFGEAGAVLCGMVLLSPMSSKSHFCVLLWPLAFCVDHWLRHRSRGARPVGVLLLAIFLLGTCTIKGLLGRPAGNWFLAHGSVTWTAALTLVATGLTLVGGDREASDPRA